MDELVFVENNMLVTDSLTVAREFRKSHDHVMRDIRTQLAKLFEAGETEWGVTNFGETLYRHPQNGQLYPKFNMTEEAFVIVAMAYVTPEAMKMKVKFIEEFKRMRDALSKPRELTRLELIELARESELARIETEKKNAELEFQLRLQEPKVALYDVAMNAHNAQSVGTVAKTLGYGPYKLFALLREKKVFFKRGRDNLPYQEYIDRGYFTVRQYPVMHNTTGIENKPQILVTARGMDFINRLLEQERAVVVQ